MKRKKILFIAAGIIAGISAAGISHAHIIPGVDVPYDPANYYSPTSISYADSAPSAFAMRELSRGDVYDYTRHIKSVLFGDDFHSIYKTVKDHLLNRITDMAGMDDEKAQIAGNGIESSLSLSESMETPEVKAIFRTSTDETPHDEQEQLAWLHAHYGHRLEDCKKWETDSTDRMQAIEAMLGISANAKGNVETLQADTQMLTMQAAENIRRNAVLSTMASTEAAHESYEIDRALRDQQRNHEGLALQVVPQTPSDRDKALSPRPEPHGFYDFR